MDAETLSAVALIIRLRLSGLARHKEMDGLERLGAQKVLTQLAKDIELTADDIAKRG